MTQDIGVRIALQDQETFPLLEEYGLDASPHTQTSIALQLVNISRQGHPYPANCSSDSWGNRRYSQALDKDHKDFYRYSLPLCQRLCLQVVFQFHSSGVSTVSPRIVLPKSI